MRRTVWRVALAGMVPVLVLGWFLLAHPGGKPSRVEAAPRSHPPLTLRVVNPNAHPRYLDWSLLRRKAPACERKVGARWEPCFAEKPFCVERCPPPGERVSCMDCAKPPDVARVIPAKGHLDVPWDGFLYLLERVPGQCSCYRRSAPPAGRYRLTFCAYSSLWCHADPGGCPKPSLDGEIRWGRPKGQASCGSVEVTLPTRAKTVVVTLPLERSR